MFLTGWYQAQDGTLRHCHNNGKDAVPGQWHKAYTTHPDMPHAHANCHSFDHVSAIWARANSNLSPMQKASLIRTAKHMHDAQFTGDTI